MRRPREKRSLDAEKAADPRSAHAAAISLLARRDFSRLDLDRKLTQRGYAPAAIAEAVAALAESNLLNDERFSENLVTFRARRGQGPARIRQELKRSGMGAETIQAAIKGREDAPDFLALARQARSRKFGAQIPKDRKERARQARFLQYRGFSTDHIRVVLDGDPEDCDSGAEANSDPDSK
jgi:regulatory protein